MQLRNWLRVWVGRHRKAATVMRKQTCPHQRNYLGHNRNRHLKQKAKHLNHCRHPLRSRLLLPSRSLRQCRNQNLQCKCLRQFQLLQLQSLRRQHHLHLFLRHRRRLLQKHLSRLKANQANSLWVTTSLTGVRQLRLLRQ